MKDIFYDLIKEASTGHINVFDDSLGIGFNTIIYENGKEKNSFYNDKNMSTLVIKNEELFLKKLEEYILLELTKKRKIPNYYKKTSKDCIKWIMSYLFTYATTEDFLNPIEYIEKRIAFLKDTSFDDYKEGKTIPLGEVFKNANLVIREETPAIAMETSHRIALSIKKDNNTYQLPSIYYSIKEENGEKVCYLYGIQKKDNRKNIPKEEQQFINRINRLLYKVNQGIAREDYSLEGEANLKDVSASFVFALSIFISLLQAKNITKIKAVTYMPVPYLARELASEENESMKDFLQERNQDIQTNITNKFIRTLRRVCAHNSSLEVISYPYEQDEFLTLSLSPKKDYINNPLLNETDELVRSHISK